MLDGRHHITGNTLCLEANPTTLGKLQFDLLVGQHKAIPMFFYAYVFQSLRLYLLGGFLDGGFRWPRRRLRGDGCIARGLFRGRRCLLHKVLAASTARKQRHHTYN